MSAVGADIVAETLRELDRDRYYASLILPPSSRAAVQALFAANAEIAATSERVSEPMPGEIRLQWWTDFLAGAARGAAAQNPIAAALSEVMDRYGLAAGPLERLVAARRFDLYQDPMPDVPTFEGYAGETASIVYQYAATILGDGTAPDTGDAAGHLGVGLAYLGHIRAFGFNSARSRIFLPLDIFAENGVSDADILARRDSEGLRAALTRCHVLGLDHLAKARTAMRSLPRQLRPAFAHIALADTRPSAGTDPFAPPRHSADWVRLLRLMWFGATLR